MKAKIVSGVMIVAMVCGVAMAPSAAAVDIYGDTCKVNPNSTFCKAQGDKANNLINNIINFLLLIAGIIAVIMLIIGGFKYSTSSGDSNATASAKNTILYAIIGLVITATAYTIVNFAYSFLTKTTP